MWTFILTCIFYSILVAFQINQDKQIDKMREELFFIRRELDDNISDFISENSHSKNQHKKTRSDEREEVKI